MGNPKSHTIGALTPLVKTRHVTTICVASPLHINVEWNPKNHVRSENLSSSDGRHGTSRWPQNPRDSWWDWRTQFPWTISWVVLIHLGATRMNTEEPLVKTFNALGSYQTGGRLLEPHQNPYSWALKHYKKGTKATIKAPTVRNHETIYIHTDQRQIRYIDSPKKYP